MRAMILAAGLGTRLRPLTEDRPKAMVEIRGRTLLEITLEQLRKYGVDQVIVNVHHFAGMVAEYLKTNDNFGMRIELSHEETLLDTGGGLKKAAWFFLEDPDQLDEPFILHNVDILSTMDLERMMQFHRDNDALATLAVQDREDSRYLLFGEQDQICGWRSKVDGKTKLVRSSARPEALAFCGIHVISPRLLPMMTDEGAFSIIDVYLNLAARGGKIVAFRADEYSWRDVGSRESLRRALEEPRT